MAEVEFIGKVDLLYICQLISSELNKYVLAVSGKGLSTEDFTTTLKNKLDGIDLTQYSTTTQMHKAIDDAIATVSGMQFVKVETLPATGQKGYIYLVPKTASGSDAYDEYYWDADNNKFELFGSTTIDLSDYLKKTDVVELSTTEVQAVWDSVFTS